jgi:4-hydroxybutyryl-CoA dehydratase/vinylacetyl-CoA-Delta-isomerase
VKTSQQYLDSLDDGRRVYFQGAEVKDLTEHWAFRTGAEVVGAGYDLYHSPEPGSYHPMYKLPRSPQELRERIDLLENSDFTASLSAGILAMLTVTEIAPDIKAKYGANIDNFLELVRNDDLRVAQVITDAKGDRTLSAGKQDDPDLYLRVVERREDGVVVRGAKFHITGGPLTHELVTIPTKRMKPGEEDYAIAFSVPINSPGVHLICSSYAPQGDDVRHYPVSSLEAMPEAMVVYDDVFVPHDRIFLNGEVEHSGSFAHALGLWERISGLADMAARADLLVGAAQLVAEANGTERIAHIKDKIAELCIYATMTRAGVEAALWNTETLGSGLSVPSELYTNAAKYYAAVGYHQAIQQVQDIAGGTIVTAPSMADLESPIIGPYIEKYLRTKVGIDARRRLAIFHLLRDITADAFGGWHLVANLQSGGGLLAQRVVTRKHYDMDHAKALAVEAAGLSEDVAG